MDSRRDWLALSGAGLLVLAGCGKSDPAAAQPAGTTPTTPTPAAPPQISPQAPASADVARRAFEAAAEARGFTTGELIAARVARVFFDPQCPHCAALWQASKPLRDRLRMVWIPVAFMSPRSAPQGAMLLASADPAALMDRHETALAAGTGGLDVEQTPPPADALASVKANTALWSRIGGSGVPHMVYRAGADGPYGVQEGQLDTAGLARLLGV